MIKNNYQSNFLEINTNLHDEPIATDTIYYKTPEIDDGFTCSQLFFGTNSLVSDVYGMKTDNKFVDILEENIHAQVAMGKLISYCDQYEVVNHSQMIL